MGYEDQLREAERILDKMNAMRKPDDEVLKRLKELEDDLKVVCVLCVIQLVAVGILVIARLGG